MVVKVKDVEVCDTCNRSTCYKCPEQRMDWELTSIFVCSHCSFTNEYNYWEMPIHDSCPVCCMTGFKRQVKINNEYLTDFNPKVHKR